MNIILSAQAATPVQHNMGFNNFNQTAATPSTTGPSPAPVEGSGTAGPAPAVNLAAHCEDTSLP